MRTPMPTLLIPGLNCSARLYEPQVPALWQFGAVVIADHRRDDSITAIAERILADAPPRFAAIGLSMGGYIAFELMRRAPERVHKLALLNTSARAESPQQTERRQAQIAMARQGRFAEIPEQLLSLFSRRAHLGDKLIEQTIRDMAHDTGPEAFVRQQTAIMGRADSRPTLASIDCPTLVIVGDEDRLTPPELATEIAQGIPGARLEVVAECGHLSTLDQPEQVTALLTDWLCE
jgi:pimeloyl-ACP methyl ester carboxylesterase